MKLVATSKHIMLFLCPAHTVFINSSFRDPIIQHAKIVLNSPMPGEPSLEYYCTIESDLLNHIITCVQHLDLELKFHEILTGKYETASELLKEHEEVDLLLANN